MHGKEELNYVSCQTLQQNPRCLRQPRLVAENPSTFTVTYIRAPAPSSMPHFSLVLRLSLRRDDGEQSAENADNFRARGSGNAGQIFFADGSRAAIDPRLGQSAQFTAPCTIGSDARGK